MTETKFTSANLNVGAMSKTEAMSNLISSKLA